MTRILPLAALLLAGCTFDAERDGFPVGLVFGFALGAIAVWNGGSK